MTTEDKITEDNVATRWMLGGEPPEPQTAEPAKPLTDGDGKPLDIRTGDTHTGTDPLGRAIGPAESHLHVKRVRNDEGKIVKPYTLDEDGKRHTIDTRAPEARVAKVAKATGTKPEAVDNPTPILPPEVARLHEDG